MENSIFLFSIFFREFISVFFGDWEGMDWKIGIEKVIKYLLPKKKKVGIKYYIVN